jgi:ABC-type transport system involved in multi-copper enzyme maturation permease subunit
VSTRSLVIVRKSMRDFSRPLWLAGFFVLYLPVTYLLSLGLAGTAAGDVEDLSTLPLHVQEEALLQAYAGVSFVWAVGIPMMVLTAVLAASAIATETERGTIEILLSKPIQRWEVLLGKFVAIVLFTLLAMVSGLLVAAAMVFYHSGASAAAIAGGIGTAVVGNVAYALLVALVVGAIGTAAAVASGSRLRTALVALLVPALFFAFIFVRAVGGDLYEDYLLYLLDVNYHFGNAFVFVHEAVGTGFSPPTQLFLEPVTGVYDGAGAGVDPLVGGMPPSVPLAGYVPPVASLGLLCGLAVALLVAGVYRFQRIDIG